MRYGDDRALNWVERTALRLLMRQVLRDVRDDPERKGQRFLGLFAHCFDHAGFDVALVGALTIRKEVGQFTVSTGSASSRVFRVVDYDAVLAQAFGQLQTHLQACAPEHLDIVRDARTALRERMVATEP